MSATLERSCGRARSAGAMIPYRNVQIEHLGRKYSARYSVEGGHLYVDCAHGPGKKARVVKDPEKVKAQAQMLLRQIVTGR